MKGQASLTPAAQTPGNGPAPVAPVRSDRAPSLWPPFSSLAAGPPTGICGVEVRTRWPRRMRASGSTSGPGSQQTARAQVPWRDAGKLPLRSRIARGSAPTPQ
ncbi:hypothetical protein RSP03_02260 [Cereibacter sphaeroides]|jgi:hypothetical protein|nr:hypothetical protein RSP03_02260 [Cereibacter sphaeroides]